MKEFSCDHFKAIMIAKGAWNVYRASELDLELGSHHGSQQGSAAASSFEGQEMDEDEAAAAADFTPMTEEKRIFVNEWIAKLGEDAPDEADPIEVQDVFCECQVPHTSYIYVQSCLYSQSMLLYWQIVFADLQALMQDTWYFDTLNKVCCIAHTCTTFASRLGFHSSSAFFCSRVHDALHCQ